MLLIMTLILQSKSKLAKGFVFYMTGLSLKISVPYYSVPQSHGKKYCSKGEPFTLVRFARFLFD